MNGLSGLLVKSVMVMESDFETFNVNDVAIPVLLAGKRPLPPLWKTVCVRSTRASACMPKMPSMVFD